MPCNEYSKVLSYSRITNMTQRKHAHTLRVVHVGPRVPRTHQPNARNTAYRTKDFVKLSPSTMDPASSRTPALSGDKLYCLPYTLPNKAQRVCP